MHKSSQPTQSGRELCCFPTEFRCPAAGQSQNLVPMVGVRGCNIRFQPAEDEFIKLCSLAGMHAGLLPAPLQRAGVYAPNHIQFVFAHECDNRHSVLSLAGRLLPELESGKCIICNARRNVAMCYQCCGVMLHSLLPCIGKLNITCIHAVLRKHTYTISERCLSCVRRVYAGFFARARQVAT